MDFDKIPNYEIDSLNDSGILANALTLEDDLTVVDEEILYGDEETVASLTKHGLVGNVTYSTAEATAATLRLLYNRGERGALPKSYLHPNHVCMIQKEEFHINDNKTADGQIKASARLDAVDYRYNINELKRNLEGIIQGNKNNTSSNNALHKATTQIKQLIPPAPVDNNFCIDVLNIIREEQSQYIDYDEVFEKLCTVKLNRQPLIAVYRNSLESYIDAIYAIYKNNIKNTQKMSVQIESSNKNKITYMLRREEKFITQLEELTKEKFIDDTQEKDSIYLIKQIIKRDADYYYKCDKCGKMVSIKSPMLNITCFFSNTMNNDKKLSLPILQSCSCGTYALLNENDTLVLSQMYIRAESKELADCKSYMLANNKDSPVARFSIGPSKLFALQSQTQLGLFKEVEDLQLDNKLYKNEKFKQKSHEIILNDCEYMQAVKVFYDNVATFKISDCMFIQKNSVDISENMETGINEDDVNIKWLEEKSTLKKDSQATQGKLKVGELANFICNYLSKDYMSEKNKAIFSLYFVIKENPVFDRITGSKLCSIASDYAVFKDCTEYNADSVPIEYLVQMATIANKYKMIDIPKGVTVSEHNEVIKRELFTNIPEKEEKLKSILNVEMNLISLCSKILEDLKDVLQFTKILNISSVKRSDLSSIFIDNNVASVIDEITDRMIICNYADTMFEKTCRVGGINLMNIKHKLDEAEDRLACKGIIEKSCSKIRETAILIDNSRTLDSYFTNMSEVGTAKLEELSIVAMNIKEGKLLTAIDITLKISPANVLQYGQDTYMMFKEACNTIREQFDLLLPGNTKDEKILQLVGFTNEEEYGNSIEIPEKLYYPMRKNFESVELYIKRLKSTTPSEWEFRVSIIDKLEPILAEIVVVSNMNHLHDIKYRNFMYAMYYISLANCCVSLIRKDSAMNILGVDDKINSLLNRDKYQPDYDVSGYLNVCCIFGNVYGSTALNEVISEVEYKYSTSLVQADEQLKFQNYTDVCNIITNVIDELSITKKPMVKKIKAREGTQDVMEEIEYDCEEMQAEFYAATEKLEGRKW